MDSDRMAEPPVGTGAAKEGEGVSCKHCDKTFPNLGELGRHQWAPESEGGHREQMLKAQKEGMAERTKKKAEEEAEKKGAPPTPPALYRGEPDATGILRGILESHPDISEAVKNEILSWAELRGQLDPQTVAYLLSQMRGVSSQTASIVAQKYSLALQKSQLEGRPGQVPVLPQMQLQQPFFQIPIQGYPFGQYPFQFPQVQPQIQIPSILGVQGVQPTPQYAAPPQPQPLPREAVTKADVEAMISKTREDMVKGVSELLKEDREKREKDKLAEAVERSSESTGKLIEKIERGELFPKTPPAAQLTEEKIAEIVGKVITGDREKKEKEDLLGVIKEGQEQQHRLLERIERGELFPKAPQAPPTPPVTKDDIAKAIEASSKAAREDILSVFGAKAKEDAAERRHQELMKAQAETQAALRSGIAAQQVAGYREDSYRLLGQGMSAVAGAIERKEPIKIILEHAPQVLYGPAAPGPKEIMPGAGGAELAGKIPEKWVEAE